MPAIHPTCFVANNDKHMKLNRSDRDRMLRLSLAIGNAALYVTTRLGGALGVALLNLATAFVVSSIFGVCPVCPLLGIGTQRKMSATI